MKVLSSIDMDLLLRYANDNDNNNQFYEYIKFVFGEIEDTVTFISYENKNMVILLKENNRLNVTNNQYIQDEIDSVKNKNYDQVYIKTKNIQLDSENYIYVFCTIRLTE